MQRALNMLGLSCYHSIYFFSNIRDCEKWNVAQDAKFFKKGTPFTRREWDQLLGSYSAISADPPAIAFAEELIEIYPEAKVILVEREIESWFKSFDGAVIRHTWSKSLNLVASCDPYLLGPVRDCHRRWTQGWMGANNEKEMQDNARQAYKDHYALVRRVTPKERLLEYKLGSGWEPLCEFLGKPVPDMPFPHVNDQEHMNEHIAMVFKQGIRNALKKAALWVMPCVVIILAWWVARK